jgi:hypothetical protein
MRTEWNVEPKKLLSVLQILDLVPSRPGIGSSSFVQLSEKNGQATMSLSSDVSGEVQVKGTGTLGLKKKFYLDRNVFFPFIFTAKSYKSDKPFVFSLSADNEMLIQQGRRKARFDCGIPGAGYGEFSGLKKAVSLPIDENIAELITIATACSTTDASVPELNCVYTMQGDKRLRFYATNQLTAFCARKKTKHTFPKSLAFPLYLVPYLKHDRLSEIWMKEKEVVLRFDCGYIWQGLSIKATKAFPVKTIQDLLTEGNHWGEIFRLPMSKLGAVTARFSDYLTSVKRQDWSLVLKGAAGDQELLLEVSIPQGTFREKVKIEAPLEVAVFIEWPLDTLLPILTHLAKIKDSVLSVRWGKKTPYLLTAGNIQVVVVRKTA